MIITVNESGQVRSVPAQINQGTANVPINVIAPHFRGSLCVVTLRAPNAKDNDFVICSIQQTADGQYLWTGRMPTKFAMSAGTGSYQISFYNPQYAQLIEKNGQTTVVPQSDRGLPFTTETGTFYIRKGVIADAPETVEELSGRTLAEIYALLSEYTGKFEEVDVAKDDAISSATDAEASAKSAIKAKEDAESAKAQAQEAFNLANNAVTLAQNARAEAQQAVLYIEDTQKPHIEAQATKAQEAYLGAMEAKQGAEEARDTAWDYVEEAKGLVGFDIIVLHEGQYDANGVPTIENPNEKDFYLVPNGDASPNLYQEWLYKDGWELIGSASVDLTDYAKKNDVLPLSGGTMSGAIGLTAGNGVTTKNGYNLIQWTGTASNVNVEIGNTACPTITLRTIANKDVVHRTSNGTFTMYDSSNLIPNQANPTTPMTSLKVGSTVYSVGTTDAHITDLIDQRLGVIENGNY